MSILKNVIEALALSNMHFCLYGGLGSYFVARAILTRSEMSQDEMYEKLFHGIVYFSLGLL